LGDEFRLSHFSSSGQIGVYMRAYLFAVGVSFFAATAFGAELNGPAIIPAPQKMEISKGQFRLVPVARIDVDEASTPTAEYLATKLRTSTGYRLPIYTNNEPLKGIIQLTTNGAKAELGPEGYELDVTPDVISIKAPTQAGLFYGVQTLMQLFPPQIFALAPVTNVAWEIPFAVHIEDQPRFQWRGFMLDTSRHFFSKNEVKRVLDEMALQKLNRFHWHLTDDQGWRIEIKKYPKLTEVGAWRTKSKLVPYGHEGGDQENDHPAWSSAPPTDFAPDGRYGGFYTQDDIREVVAYAAARHIIVVPEIEMPGHSVAALAAYPELSCVKGNFSTDIDAGVNHGVFCVGNEKVVEFLDDVLTEVFQLFPGKYVHIGGDEVDTRAKNETWGKDPGSLELMKANGYTNLDQLQGWFTGQMGKFVSEHGKTLVGWSEIADAPLPKDAVVMDWIGGAMQAATNGHDVVMSPTKFCYLDYYQSIDHGTEPGGIGNFLPLERVYSFEPIPVGLPPEYQSHILGGQCNLWTEYISSIEHVEYMAFPRLCALAEVVWSPKAARDWNGFKQRLQIQELRFDQFDVNYRHDLSVKIGEWTPAQLSVEAAGTNLEWDVTSQVKAPGQYRVTFQWSRGTGLTIRYVSLLEDGKEVASDGHAGFAARNPTRPVYVLNLSAAKPVAKYTIRASVVGGDTSGTVTSVFKAGKKP
jgi:hexosaminidase